MTKSETPQQMADRLKRIIAILIVIVFWLFMAKSNYTKIEQRGYERGYLQCSDAQSNVYYFYFDGKEIHGEVPNSKAMIEEYCKIGMGKVIDRGNGLYETECEK